jgi:hypothetical protein
MKTSRTQGNTPGYSCNELIDVETIHTVYGHVENIKFVTSERIADMDLIYPASIRPWQYGSSLIRLQHFDSDGNILPTTRPYFELQQYDGCDYRFTIVSIIAADGTTPEDNYDKCDDDGGLDLSVTDYCCYPWKWESVDIELIKFDYRDILEYFRQMAYWADKVLGLDMNLAEDIEKFLEYRLNFYRLWQVFKRISIQRECIVVGQDAFNPNIVRIGKGLQIGVAEHFEWSLDFPGFIPPTSIDLDVSFWVPVPGFDRVLKTIESPQDCPPPQVKVQCCSPEGCHQVCEVCPPGITCEIEYKGYLCCYGKDGKVVREIKL